MLCTLSSRWLLAGRIALAPALRKVARLRQLPFHLPRAVQPNVKALRVPETLARPYFIFPHRARSSRLHLISVRRDEPDHYLAERFRFFQIHQVSRVIDDHAFRSRYSRFNRPRVRVNIWNICIASE
jgi:hypothetical protein